ncbi:hypothetical protein DITRI_Ditri08aG0033400 [Diplodiscus trichospermus]
MASQTSMDYDRTKELKHFDDTKAGVKGVGDAGIVNIPEIFIRPPEELAAEELNSCQTNIKVPIIDLSNIQDSSRHKEIVDEVRIASEKWGLFQVMNHGIPLNVLDEMIDGVRKFNEQDLELKKELYSRDATKKVRFNSNFDLYNSGTADCRDTLTLSFLDSDPDPNEMPEVCRKSTMEYTKYIRRLGETLFELLSEALGLNQRNQRSPSPSGGLMITSNDKLKSVKHRVTANHVGPKISVPSFFSGHFSMFDKPFGPIKELTSESNPPRNKEVLLREYIDRFYSSSLDKKLPIDYCKL